MILISISKITLKHAVKRYTNLKVFFSLSSANQHENLCMNLLKGIDHIKDPRLHKGLAFTFEERQALGLHGLLAPKYKTQEEQVEHCKMSFDAYEDDFNKYLFLCELQERNERLFYSLMEDNIEKYLPIVYTPTVGLVCQKFGIIYRRPRGLFITIADKGHVLSVLNNWPEPDIKALCVTDGERILGLGDLGAHGMGIPVGKLSLYTALAGIKPHQCLPITLDVGTNNKALLEDHMYIGLHRERVKGKEYDDFIDEFMQAVVDKYGPNVLVQFEDFALPNAGRLLEKYKNSHCTFNDDIQGTASVSVAGLFAATRLTKKKMSENTILFLGAGSAANGIANLTCQAMVEEGMALEKARERIFMFDVDGLVTSKRSGGVPDHVKNFVKDLEPEKDFGKFVETMKPTVLIGCSTVGGAFTPQILQQMGKNAERPIIFALSNPTSKAECTAQAAYDNTEGRCIFASGSPFPPVKYKDKTYTTGQGNNSYIFPGVALGVIAVSAHHISDSIFLTAAKTVAECVTEDDLAKGRIYPPILDLKKISFKIAINVAEAAYKLDFATIRPKPANLEAYIKTHMYDLKYLNYLPSFYPFPDSVNANPSTKKKTHVKTPKFPVVPK